MRELAAKAGGDQHLVRDDAIKYGSGERSPLRIKSFEFALATAKALRGCYSDDFQRHFAHQVVRSATATAAAIEEANGAASKKQFIYKIKHALQEANESKLWLSLIAGLEDLISRGTIERILHQGNEVRYMLAAVIKTYNQRYVSS